MKQNAIQHVHFKDPDAAMDEKVWSTIFRALWNERARVSKRKDSYVNEVQFKELTNALNIVSKYK